MSMWYLFGIEISIYIWEMCLCSRSAEYRKNVSCVIFLHVFQGASAHLNQMARLQFPGLCGITVLDVLCYDAEIKPTDMLL
jgi:hypothetical protein